MESVTLIEEQIRSIKAMLAAGVVEEIAVELHKQLTRCIELHAILTHQK
ncbi:hypothetical protein GCM10025857_14820 [Alicyclobacillus contaminans]|nr:hypothetical protein [Alicyclobacillus contaminans]GMA50125.1 hypothetical protein GCM10025857_14820 [Alicyclobacillus contaminans]